jgi:hypothetical protein
MDDFLKGGKMFEMSRRWLPYWVSSRKQYRKGSASVAAISSLVGSNDSEWDLHVQGYFTEDCRWRSEKRKENFLAFCNELVTAELKEARVAACQDLIDRVESDPDVFNRIVSGDESWCFAYDIATSVWAGQNSPRPQKLPIQKPRVKTMLVIFLDWPGVMHKEFVPEGQPENSEFCTEERWTDCWRDFGASGRTRLYQVTGSGCTIMLLLTTQLSSSSFSQIKALLLFTISLNRQILHLWATFCSLKCNLTLRGPVSTAFHTSKTTGLVN